MSWLARSFANSLRMDDGDGEDDENDIVLDSPTTTSSRNNCPQQQLQIQPPQPNNAIGSESEGETQGRGVKEDLDEIKQTLSRQFWGMASFLAPPPTSDSHPSPPFISGNEQQQQLDYAAALSNHSSHMEQRGPLLVDDPDPDPDPNLIQSGSDSEDNQEPEYDLVHAVGITEEVLAFALNIAMHPETWLDFPIEEEDDTDDFEMTDAQQEHAMEIERLAPRLAALRIELCPCHMSEGYFWKVYFVLVHSRLNKQDAEILSTPQVTAARAMWMQELHKKTKPEYEFFGRSAPYSIDNAEHDDFNPSILDDSYSDDLSNRTYEYKTISLADYETEKHAVESSGTHFIDKSVIEENPVIKTENNDVKCGRPSQIIIQDYDDDDDDEWPEEDSDLGGCGGTTLPLVNEEDISFSDLEDDDYGIKPVSSNTGSKVI